MAALLLALALAAAGCAKYNTYYNARKAFDAAERVRDEALRKNQDPPAPAGKQKQDYERAIQKAQKVLDEYPGNSLTDDALFLQAKAWHRLEGYRMSVRKLDLLFQNYPATEYLEEALYLQGLNYLLIGAVSRSQDFLDRLQRKFPDSKYRAEVLKVSGDNAYALQEWETAAEAYRRYLDQEADIQERDRVGLKLAECYWELEDYYGAAAVLQEVSQTAESRDLRFQARMLQARVHVRIGDFEVADLLLDGLRAEAEVYNVRGEVLLIEAESLIAQDRGDEAAPLLESMPKEWETPVVRARARDLLGYLYLERDEWEKASIAFNEAMRSRKDLDEPERTRRYAESLRDYLAAEQRLVDATGADVARYQLLQANALLFGAGRPHLAADLYIQAAADSAADTTVAARALYGAYLTYDRLDRPDSASIFATRLEERFPESPQAYEASLGGESNLLGYLLERRDEQQAANYAALSDSARAALRGGLGAGDDRFARTRSRDTGLRRRMVYLQRRDNLVFAPTPDELETAAGRRAEATLRTTPSPGHAGADTAAVGAPAGAATGTVPPPTPESIVPGVVVPPAAADAAPQGPPPPEGAPARPEEATGTAQKQDQGTQEDEQAAADEDAEDDEPEEEEKDDTHDLW